MADFLARQRVQIHDGTNELGVINANPFIVALDSVSLAALEDITVTVDGDGINVQLTHDGSPYDSVRIGDGTETVAVNASNELQVIDDGANALLATIDADTSIVAAAVAAGQMQVDIVADGAGLALAANQLADGHNVTVDNGAAGAAVNIQDGGNSITVDGTVTANLSATDNAVLDTIETNTDFGTVVGGGVEATALRVTIANDSTGLVSIDDGGSSITVDGTVAVSSITSDVSIDDGGNSITVDASNLDIRDLTHVSDSVAIGDGTDTLDVNADGSINVNVVTAASGDAIHDVNTADSVPKPVATVPQSDLTSIVYVASGGTFLCTSVVLSASGSFKALIKAGADGAEVDKSIVFSTAATPTVQVDFDPAIEVDNGDQLMVDVWNTDNADQNIYGTIIGRQL